MQQFQTIVVNSVLTRFLANIFLFVLVLGSAFIAGCELVHNIPVNTWLVAILGTALGSSIKMLGISTGVALVSEEKQA